MWSLLKEFSEFARQEKKWWLMEEIVVRLARHAREVTGQKNLCLAGGVALNCVANGIILREKIFENIWI